MSVFLACFFFFFRTLIPVEFLKDSVFWSEKKALLLFKNGYPSSHFSMLAVDRLNEGEMRFPRSIPNAFYVAYIVKAHVLNNQCSSQSNTSCLP